MLFAQKKASTNINILKYLCIVNACLPVTYYIIIMILSRLHSLINVFIKYLEKALIIKTSALNFLNYVLVF